MAVAERGCAAASRLASGDSLELGGAPDGDLAAPVDDRRAVAREEVDDADAISSKASAS